MSSTGAYGTTIPSKIRNSDIDIFYAYHETRTSDSVDNAVFKKLPSSILTDVLYDSDGESIDNVLEGLYNLKLPLEYFNRKGFYTVYIKPKEIPAVIADVSSLTSFPNVRGIVIDSKQITDTSFSEKVRDNNALVGYRIIFINDNGTRENYYRLVTSNNKCEPVVESSNESGNKSYTYRYNDTQFCLEVEADAIQTHNPKEAIKSIWGVDGSAKGMNIPEE